MEPETNERPRRPRRAFIITVASVSLFFSLLYLSALKMNAMPVPEKLKPYAIPRDRVLEKSTLLTYYWVDGLPEDEVFKLVREGYEGETIEFNVMRTGRVSSSANVSVDCSAGRETCTLALQKKLSPPQVVFEQLRMWAGL